LGMAVLSGGLFALSRLTGQASILSVMEALAIVGFGTGVFISPNNSALMGSAPRSRQGIAAGILATARNFGMVLGVGIAGAVYTIGLNHAASAGIAAQNGAIYSALEMSFLVASVIMILGVLTSMVRIVRRS
jgi:hypothetical protein